MKLLTVLACLLMPVTVAAQVPTGPGRMRVNGGSIPQTAITILPGENIQAFIDANPEGTTFLLRAGWHRLYTPLTPKSGDTFLGDVTSGGTRLTRISGARILTGWIDNGDGRWYVTGQSQQGPVSTVPLDECQAAYQRCVYPEQLFFDDSVMKKHEVSLAATGAGEWFFDYPADRIYVGDNPIGHTVETSVITAVTTASAADNVTFRGVIIEKFAARTDEGALNLGASALGGDNWLADNVEARWNHGAGIGMDTNSRVRGSYLHHNCGYGVKGSGAGLLVDYNEIAYNNILPQSSTETCGYNYFNGAVTKWTFTTGLIARGNHVHHNYGLGLWTDISNLNTLYEDNLVEENLATGIFHEISYDAIIRNNYAINNGTLHEFPYYSFGAGINVATSRNVQVYGNHLVGNWQGITGLDDNRSGVISTDQTSGLWVLTNLNVHDNEISTLVTIAGGGRTGIVNAGSPNNPYAANNHFENNHYILGSNANYFFWAAGDMTEAAWAALGNDDTCPGGCFTR